MHIIMTSSSWGGCEDDMKRCNLFWTQPGTLQSLIHNNHMTILIFIAWWFLQQTCIAWMIGKQSHSTAHMQDRIMFQRCHDKCIIPTTIWHTVLSQRPLLDFYRRSPPHLLVFSNPGAPRRADSVSGVTGIHQPGTVPAVLWLLIGIWVPLLPREVLVKKEWMAW